MIKIIDGDLLTSNTDIIAHQVNCKGAFNSGVAKAIRDYDVQVYKDYHSFCSINTPEQLLGSVRYFQSNIDARIYANLFAQKSYGYAPAISLYFTVRTDKNIPSGIHPLPLRLLFLHGLPILPETGLCAYLRL